MWIQLYIRVSNWWPWPYIPEVGTYPSPNPSPQIQNWYWSSSSSSQWVSHMSLTPLRHFWRYLKFTIMVPQFKKNGQSWIFSPVFMVLCKYFKKDRADSVWVGGTREGVGWQSITHQILDYVLAHISSNPDTGWPVDSLIQEIQSVFFEALSV